MVNPVSSAQTQYATQQTSSKQTPAPTQTAQSAPQDTVSLSKAARGGDVDHDGDSH
jgi:hypothetical protein